MFKTLNLSEWRQFKNVSIDLSNPMTVITGVNGSGKTTILSILGQHFGWNIPWKSTYSKHKSKSKFWSDVWSLWDEKFEPKENMIKIGNIEYSNNQICELRVPVDVNEQYKINYLNQIPSDGIFIPSHIQPLTHQKITNIPIDPKTTGQQFQEYQNLIRQVYSSENIRNPAMHIKSSIISFGVFGYGNPAVIANEEYKNIFEALSDSLSILLPKEIGFKRIEIRTPEVVLVTNSGTFSIDATSGGIGSLLSIAWQLVIYGIDKDSFVALFDEPENHLHPSMQRELLPNLEKAFPNIQFILATHSPFIVNSNKNAKVYALNFVNNHIESTLLDESNLSGDYNQTLREILDVPITIPKWVEKEIIDTYKTAISNNLDKSSLDQLRRKLFEIGLYPNLTDILDSIEEDQNA